MTKKHFEAIAETIREMDTTPAAQDRLACSMAKTLARFNAAFDADRFVAACTPPAPAKTPWTVPPQVERFTYTCTSSHLRRGLDTAQRAVLVRNAVRIIKESAIEFDFLAAQGLSGLLFGTSLADALGVPLVVARKRETPEPHSISHVEGPDRTYDNLRRYRWLFVDDLIASGATFRRVSRLVGEVYPGECVGLVLYDTPFGAWASANSGITLPALYVGGER